MRHLALALVISAFALVGAEVTLEEGASFTGRIEADFELPPELVSLEAQPGER